MCAILIIDELEHNNQSTFFHIDEFALSSSHIIYDTRITQVLKKEALTESQIWTLYQYYILGVKFFTYSSFIIKNNDCKTFMLIKHVESETQKPVYSRHFKIVVFMIIKHYYMNL